MKKSSFKKTGKKEIFDILLPMFFSTIFIILGLTFKSSVHSEFILLSGIRKVV